MFDLAGEPEYWFALVAASPRVEIGEAVAVAIVVGNGQPTRLEYVTDLPRLRCITTTRELAVFERILASVREQVAARSMELTELKSLLGPQLHLLGARTLFYAPTDEVVAELKEQFLERPHQAIGSAEVKALRLRSVRVLDRVLESAAPITAPRWRSVTPQRLYETSFNQTLGFKAPAATTAVRLNTTDVIIESILVEAGTHTRALREVASRASMVFYSFDKIRSRVLRSAKRKIELVGVIHKSPAGAEHTTTELREFVRYEWRDVRIVDGDREDESSVLRALMQTLP